MIIQNLRIAFVTLIAFTLLTGLVYPFLVTGIAGLAFPERAAGSMVRKEGKLLGSELIGQPFSDPKYFWGRLSATGPFAYNAASSYASNFGPLNAGLMDAAKQRIHDLAATDSHTSGPVPVDLVTASGSGLDPHISIAAALYQLPRVARRRGLPEQQVHALIDQYTQPRFLSVLGEPSVNVLEVNLALDAIRPSTEK